MIKKIYNFFKKILSQLEENQFNSTVKNFSSSENIEGLAHKAKNDSLNDSPIIQTFDEINPTTGQISYGGVDVLGNPYGSDINNPIDNVNQDFGNSFNNDFNNH